LHDEVVYFELAGSSFNYLLFHRALGDKPVDDNLLLLANAVRSVNRL